MLYTYTARLFPDKMNYMGQNVILERAGVPGKLKNQKFNSPAFELTINHQRPR
jgi:hypothetical protein